MAEAAARQKPTTTERLMLHACDACGACELYPRTRCPRCGGATFSDRMAAGTATLVSWSVVHRAPSEEFAPDAPYVIALVRLAEGPQMMTRIVDAADTDLRAGTPLRLRFATIAGRAGMPVFTRRDAGS